MDNTINYYTLDEAIDHLAESGLYTMEAVQSMVNEAVLSERRKQRNRLRHHMKQKISGAALLVSGITSLLLGAGSYSLFAVPFGLYLMATKNKVMDI